MKIISIDDFLKDTVNNKDLSKIKYNDILVSEMNLRQLQDTCKDYGFSSFLTTSDTQVKLGKNKKELGLYSIGISLKPDTQHKIKVTLDSGEKAIITLCSNSNSSCRQSCVIVNSGNPIYLEGKNKAMQKRTELLFDNPSLFFAMYLRYIELKVSYCIKNDLLLSVRNNIASDIKLEQLNITYKQFPGFKLSSVIAMFIEQTNLSKEDKLLQYDYTKHHDRKKQEDYFLAYSVCDFDNNKISKALNNGLPLAMIFNTPRNKDLPETYTLEINGIKKALPIVDGDKHDFLPESEKLFNDNHYIYGLRFKHKAKHKKEQRQSTLDKYILSGFVRNVA